jgi:hypothetical protein
MQKSSRYILHLDPISSQICIFQNVDSWRLQKSGIVLAILAKKRHILRLNYEALLTEKELLPSPGSNGELSTLYLRT